LALLFIWKYVRLSEYIFLVCILKCSIQLLNYLIFDLNNSVYRYKKGSQVSGYRSAVNKASDGPQ